ncbi:MAG: hypothetical protein HUJ29_02680 [Gammaproteobacteria bacterium]|nr:hypothetical protein [Gammaproteobacteria bacterium]
MAQFNQFLPILIGALVAIVSMLAGGWVLYRFLDYRERKRNLREQLGELLSQAYEVEHWLKRLRSAELLNGPPINEPNPMKHVKTISRLYVPVVRPEVRKLDRAVDQFEEWVHEGVAEKKATRSVSDKTLSKYPVVQRAVMDAITDLANRAESLVVQR